MRARFDLRDLPNYPTCWERWRTGRKRSLESQSSGLDMRALTSSFAANCAVGRCGEVATTLGDQNFTREQSDDHNGDRGFRIHGEILPLRSRAAAGGQFPLGSSRASQRLSLPVLICEVQQSLWLPSINTIRLKCGFRLISDISGTILAVTP